MAHSQFEVAIKMTETVSSVLVTVRSAEHGCGMQDRQVIERATLCSGRQDRQVTLTRARPHDRTNRRKWCTPQRRSSSSATTLMTSTSTLCRSSTSSAGKWRSRGATTGPRMLSPSLFFMTCAPAQTHVSFNALLSLLCSVRACHDTHPTPTFFGLLSLLCNVLAGRGTLTLLCSHALRPANIFHTDTLRTGSSSRRRFKVTVSLSDGAPARILAIFSGT